MIFLAKQNIWRYPPQILNLLAPNLYLSQFKLGSYGLGLVKGYSKKNPKASK